jgi:hypothetical protein
LISLLRKFEGYNAFLLYAFCTSGLLYMSILQLFYCEYHFFWDSTMINIMQYLLSVPGLVHIV